MQTLRQLARDYARGAIGKDKYRQSRTELIKGIIAGDITVKDIDYEPPLVPSDESDAAITEGIVRDDTQITSPQNNLKPNAKATPAQPKPVPVKKKKNSPLLFILVSIVIVISLILAVILFYPEPPKPITSTKTSVVTKQPKSAPVPTESTIAETLIADFLNQKNWNDDNLDKFIESWSALSDKEQNFSKQTKRMQRLSDSIYKQFLDAKALATIDSQKAISKQQKLIEFAQQIGINDSRLIIE
jgi:hypothetical protein